MKKSIIVLIVVAALVVIVSPGIVGMLAERSVVEKQLEQFVETGADGVSIETLRFDRGWFTSEGKHRVVFNGELTAEENAQLEAFLGGPMPDLIIETRVDHGILPLGSLTRSGDSTLKPSLGSAVSTLSLDFNDGEPVTLPGTLHTDIGFSGELSSRYALAAGTWRDVTWGDAEIRASTDATGETSRLDADIERLSYVNQGFPQRLDNVVMRSEMTLRGDETGEGWFDMQIDSVTSQVGDISSTIGPMSMRYTLATDAERIDTGGRIEIEASDAPGVGSMAFVIDLGIEGLDAAGFERLMEDIADMPADNEDPAVLLEYGEEALMDIAAAGFDFEIREFDVTMAAGTVSTRANLSIPASDRDEFTWSSLLLLAELEADVSIPAALYNMAAMMSPEAAQAVEMGILKQNGDAYEAEAMYKKGLLTVNGAPFPIPLELP